jgi:hypothetical protein
MLALEDGTRPETNREPLRVNPFAAGLEGVVTMNDRQTRLLTILSAVLLVLVAALVLARPPKDETADGETWDSAFGETVDASAITGIDLEGPSGAVHLQKNEGAWRLMAPLEGLADERKAGDLARALTELEIGPALDVGDSSLASFGLDAPIVARLDRGDKPPLTVKVGKDAPVGMRTYVQIGDDSAVHVSRERIRGSVAMGVDDLRDHAVARFDRSEVGRIEIGAPTALAFHQDELGWWVSEGTGGELRADEERVRSFVQDVLDVRADDFPPASTWEGRTAIDALPIRLWLGAATEPVLVEVDRWAADEWSVSGPAQKEPVRVRIAPLPGMSLSVDPWTATVLLPVRDAQLSAVRLETPRSTFAATRKDGSWDPAAGGSVVSALAASRVDRSRTLDVAPGEPTGRIELEENGQRSQTLTLFPALANGDVPARDRDGGPVFVVSASQIEGIERAASADTHATAEPASAP